MLLFFLRLAEAKAILTFICSIILIIPSCIRLCLLSNYLYLILYFMVVLLLMRWFARGGQFPDIHMMNLEGQTFLITGAAGGIGKETACELAKRGAQVILFARPTNLADAIHDVKKVARKPNNIIGFPLDLADLRSIKSCVEQFSTMKNIKITALINNAGVMACPYGKTKDGFELQMGTNHFGHFYFTKLLLHYLQSSRIINVSSAAHFMWSVPCDSNHYNKMCHPKTYHPWSAYSLSKTANILFTRQLQERYSLSHNIRAYSLHPGSVNTRLDRHLNVHDIIRKILEPIKYFIVKTPLEGAQTTLYCALSNQAKPGEYHSDCQPAEVFHQYAKNDKLAREWWTYSETLINEKLKEIESI